MRRALAPTLGLLVLTTLSCGDDDKGPTGPNEPASPTTGSIQVSLAMSGGDVDPDGFTVTVDGGSGQQLNVGATIAFSHLAAGTHEIAIGDVAANCQADGGASRSVTVVAGETARETFEVLCDWRSRIAFVAQSPSDFDTDIFVVNPDGTGRVDLTDHVDEDPYYSSDDLPLWSPDGTRIAFQRGFPYGRFSDIETDIFAMNRDGTGQVNLTNNPKDWRRMSWSPDGTRIAFECSGDICLVDSAGTGQVQLIQNGSSPSWSPDGTRIAFSVGDQPSCGIWVVNADGTGAVQLTYPNSTEHDLQPAWSPDGTRIAFSRRTVLEREVTDGIWVMRADGTEHVQVASGHFPSWSPDGIRIAFVEGVPNWGDEIFLVHPDGTGQINLTNHRGVDTHPITWSPDATQIVFRCDHGICVVGADGTGFVRLTPYEEECHSPAWSPDLY